MKLLLGTVILQFTQSCRLLVDSREGCQTICDHIVSCEAWVFDKTHLHCFLKPSYGWTVTKNERYDAGFKNQGPWYLENTDFVGASVECG